MIDAPGALVEPMVIDAGRPALRRWTSTRRRPILVLVCLLQLAIVARTLQMLWPLFEGIDDWLFFGSLAGGSLAWVAVGTMVCDRQPRNRCGRLMLGFAFVWSLSALLLAMLIKTGWQPSRLLLIGLGLVLAAPAPLLAWLFLAWPTGRLTPTTSRLLGVFSVVIVGFYLIAALTIPLDLDKPSALINELAVVVDLLFQLGGLVAVLVVLVRRQHRLPPVAQRAVRPVTIAAAIVVLVEFLFWIGEDLAPDTRENPGPNLVLNGGQAVGFIAVALLFVVAASRRNRGNSAASTVDLGQVLVTEPIADVLAETLNDRSARLLFRIEDDWVDGVGSPAGPMPSDRHRTMIDRDRVSIAAIEHDPTVLQRPAALEAAAGALALLVDHDALDAQTRSRLHELGELRVSILDAEDAARTQLERDLHDGAQQQLLALALDARAGSATGLPRPDLADQILLVRDELVGMVGGLVARVVSEHGLERSLRTVTSLAPRPVELSVEVPDAVPPPIAAGAWFVVNEGLANATKHAHANEVVVDVRPAHDQLLVSVTDDGSGLADASGHGLTGLARRVAALGGELIVRSAPGAGTSLSASLPLGGAR